LARFSTPSSRWNVMAVATLLKQALIAAKVPMDAT